MTDPTTTPSPDETRRYRKRPVVVDAVQFDGTWASVNDWLTALGYDEEGDGTDGGPACHMDGDNLVVQTLEGDMTAGPGWWIIRGVAGEFYPCESSIFARTYEVAALPAAALDDLHGRIFALSMQWLRDQAEYPDTREGRAAAAAVRLCGQEMTAALAARPAPVVPEGDGSWWGSEDCHERECEDFGDPEPGEKRLDPETDWPCSHIVRVPAHIERWIRESEHNDRPAPVVSGEAVEAARMAAWDDWEHFNWSDDIDMSWPEGAFDAGFDAACKALGLTVADEGRAGA